MTEETGENLNSRRKQHRPATFLREHERDALLASVENPRDRAILSTFVFTGMRSNELRMLDRGDVDFQERTILVRHAKRGKWRQLPLHPRAAEALQAYLTTRSPYDEEPALFVSNRRRRIANSTLRDLVKKYTRAWPKRVSPHTLRHTFGTSIYGKTKDLLLTQRLMGHSSSAVTERYVHMAGDEARRAVDEL